MLIDLENQSVTLVTEQKETRNTGRLCQWLLLMLGRVCEKRGLSMTARFLDIAAGG